MTARTAGSPTLGSPGLAEGSLPSGLWPPQAGVRRCARPRGTWATRSASRSSGAGGGGALNSRRRESAVLPGKREKAPGMSPLSSEPLSEGGGGCAGSLEPARPLHALLSRGAPAHPAPPRPCPGSPRAFWEWILNSRKALAGIRRVVNTFLAGIDSSKACVKEEPGSGGSFQK